MRSESTSMVIPVHSPKGVSRSKKLPVKLWALSMGRPWSRSPSATPSRNGIRALPTVMAHRHELRQRGSSNLRWYSKETPRAMRAARTSTRAR